MHIFGLNTKPSFSSKLGYFSKEFGFQFEILNQENILHFFAFNIFKVSIINLVQIFVIYIICEGLRVKEKT